MFRSWSLTNFKSVRESQRLDLGTLNIFAGANNSGKSSLLQSMLIVAQTIRSVHDEGYLVVDGELFRRGEPTELVHHGTDKLHIAFEADFGESSRQLVSQRYRSAQLTVAVGVEFRLVRRAPWPDKRFELVESRVEVRDQEGDTLDSLVVVRRRRRWKEPIANPPPWLADSLDYHPAKGNLPRNVVGISLSHFLPVATIWRVDAKHERFAQLVRSIEMRRAAGDPETRQQALDLASMLLDDPRLESLDEITTSQLRAIREARRQGLTPAIRQFLGTTEPAYTFRRQTLPPFLDDSLQSVRLLAQQVYHLGPLRLPPQFVYAAAPYSRPGWVGSAGEFAVAELDRNRQKPVVTLNPNTNKVEELTLETALQQWLKHLGIIERFWTAHRAKIGHYLWVRPPDLAQFVDLTNVGVGASQVLPVLVQALIAPVGSILIFEQPELHLHPRVQALLADFFIGMSRTGRQCFVETHSEHLVNRLRLRIAESEAPELLHSIRIFFVERVNGQSQYRKVALNEFGSIEDWPEGFFDESQAEAERIIVSSVRKHAGQD